MLEIVPSTFYTKLTDVPSLIQDYWLQVRGIIDVLALFLVLFIMCLLVIVLYKLFAMQPTFVFCVNYGTGERDGSIHQKID